MHLRICGLFLLVCGLGNEAGVGQEQLTASQIADRIEDVAKQYRSVRYSTIFNVTKSANPFKREENPKLVTGNGRTSYTRQGEKWVVDLHSFTLSMNSGKKTKTHTGGGFDGGLHWHRDADEVTLAEEFGSGPTYDPSELFWHGARNRGWLLAALRKDSAKVVGTELVEGQECLKVESEFKDYRFRFSIAPNAAFLPLRSECAIKGHVQGVETLSQLRQSESGLWYPGRIRIEHPDLPMPYVVKRIAVRALESADDVLPEVFQPKQPFGLNVVDHRRGFAFHNDPWWSEMEPILREQFSWPRADLNALQQLSSYEAESGGKPVPKVHAAEWINGDPGEWNREGRNVTVVWFYGGRAIIPSPKVWSSIRRLHEIYSGFGLDVIGVTPATDEPAIVKDAARMMKLPFPIAIDSEGEGDWGKTFDTFGLRPYTGVFLVDHKGILHTIEQKNTGFDEPSELEAVVRKLLVESGSKPLPKVVTPNEHDISDKFRQVHARWKSIVAEGVAESTLSGTISGGYNDKGPIPLAGAVVEIEPSFKMLSSNSVSSYITGGDRSRRQTAETDAKGKYRFENLPKGYYKITITADGRAFNKQELIVGEATGVTYDAELPTEHTIIGRVISAEDKLSVEEAVIKIIGRHIDPKNPDVVTKSYPQPTSQLDAEGVFAFEYLQTGKYILEISADGFKKRVMQMVPLGEKELIIQLQKED